MWGMWGLVCAATWATNAHTPVGRLYAVSHNGFAAAGARVLILLGWPIGFAAIGLLIFSIERLFAAGLPMRGRAAVAASGVAVIVLCATAALPGVIDQKHLDEAKLRNVPAALGTLLALGLALAAARIAPGDPPPQRSRYDRFLILALIAALFASIPWILANLGVYAGDVPGLRSIFMSKQVVPELNHPHLRAVHLGNHDGFDGILLAITAAVALRYVPQLRRIRLRGIANAYLSVLLVYGLAVALGDFWTEEIVKRGWTNERIPGLGTLPAPLDWAGIIVVGLGTTLAIHRRFGGAAPSTPRLVTPSTTPRST